MGKWRSFAAAGTITAMVICGVLSAGLVQGVFAEGEGLERLSGSDLPAPLQDLFIQDRFVPARGYEEAGVIHRLEGRVIVVHRASEVAYVGRKGDTLFENDELHTLSNARCRILLNGDDVVRMGEKTRLGLDALTHDRKQRKKSSFFSMLKGKAMFYTLRLLGYGRTSCRVRTPTAVAGVRGTKFGVHVYEEGQGLLGRSGPRVAAVGPLAQLGGAAGIVTDVFSVDGLVDVNGQPVPAGTLFQGQTGQVVPLPPGFVGAFEQGLGGTPPPAPTGGTGGDPVPGVGAGGAASGGDGSASGTLADLVQEQTGDGTQQGGGSTGGAGGDTVALPDIAAGKAGDPIKAIAAIVGLWKLTGGTGFIDAGIFVGEGEAYEVAHDGDSNYRMRLEDGRVEDLTWPNISGMPLGTDLADEPGMPSPKTAFDFFQGGEYTDADGESYLEWGWWEKVGEKIGTYDINVGTLPDPDREYYPYQWKIWQVKGTRTHPDYIDYLQTQSAVYTYSGESKGVIGCDGGNFVPQEVSGTFSCDIDFGSRALSEFKIDATGPAGYEVHLAGSGTVSPEGDLDLDTLGGTITGGGYPTENTVDALTGAQGAVMGKQADGVGGLWHAGGDNGYALGAGEFHGER